MLRGVSITGPRELFVAYVDHPPEEPPKSLLTGGILVMSRPLLDFLLSLGVDNLQSWPTRLVNPDTALAWEGYALVNVIGMVSAVAMGSSRYDTLIGGDPAIPPLVDFDELVLRGDRCADLRMFRVPESPWLLFIDEVVADALFAQRPPGGWGLNLREVEVR